MKYCKECINEIDHNKKRRLCTDCLKNEANEANKYWYFKNKTAKLNNVLKPKKVKTGICKCGNEIEHNLKRLICMDCIRKENRQNYNFKKEVYNKTRKEKRKFSKEYDTRFCVICETEFKTLHAIKCTCSFECSEIHRRKLSNANYHNKKVSKSNNK